jgi:cytochrome b6-f complex iron-sulfur subunit
VSTALAIALVVIGVLAAGALVAASMRRRDTDRATGHLARETVSRDKNAERSHIEGDLDPRVAGREVEEVAVQKWREPSKELSTVGGKDLSPYMPPDPETLGVTRRQFLNRSIVIFMGFSISVFGAQVIAFLWPQASDGFGSKIRVGKLPEIKTAIGENDGFLYVPEGKMWVTEYPAAALDKARDVYSEQELSGMENGLIALFQKCPHLGCRVPDCQTSQWFECPCHGSRYNQVGEKKGGPAPRGMDRFAMEVDSGDNFLVDTGTIIQGPPIGTNTTGQEQEGPSCLGAGSHG